MTSPTRTSPIKGAGEWRRMVTETMRVAAGRIFGYGRLDRHRQVEKLVPGLATMCAPLAAAVGVGADVTAPIRGWCNRQHDRFWSCNWGFDSSPPSAAADLPRSSSGLGRQVLILVTRVQIPYGVPCGPSKSARATFFSNLSRAHSSRCARIRRCATRCGCVHTAAPSVEARCMHTRCATSHRATRVYCAMRISLPATIKRARQTDESKADRA